MIESERMDEDMRNWEMMKNTWRRGVDYFVFKRGRKWVLAQCFAVPMSFSTKTAAYEYGTNLVLNESLYKKNE